MAGSIKGLEKALKKIESLEGLLAEEVRKEMRKALVPVRAEAKALAPVDTGALRRSIRIKTEIKDGQIIGKVGTYLHYGKYVELGTSKMYAQPFLLPAFYTWRDEVDRDIKERIVKVIAKVGE